MRDIRVNKDSLLGILRVNRGDHRSAFLNAQDAFRERVIEELDRRLDDAKNGRKIEMFINLPVPEDHTDDYDRVIQMLEMSLDDEILLSEGDARMYVQNQWAWAASFASNTTSYLTT